jgi:hypothetical protein
MDRTGMACERDQAWQEVTAAISGIVRWIVQLIASPTESPTCADLMDVSPIGL